MKLYKKRMQIEEIFRDLKNMRNGLGLRDCRSFKVERLSVALLIGALAMFVLWIFGMTAEQKKQHYSFQSNTVKNRSVLSTFVIGWQVLMRKQIIPTKKECYRALKYIASIAATGDNYAE